MSRLLQLGDMALHRLEVSPERQVEATTFFSGCAPAIVRDALSRVRAGTMLSIARCCSLLEIAGLTILIDPAGDGDAPADSLRQALAEAGRTPGEIDIVVCTHVHEDRIAGVTARAPEGYMPAFPGARHLIHGAELAFLRESWLADAAGRYGRLYERHVRPLEQAGILETVTGDHALLERDGLAIGLAEAPGHTPGHMVVRMRSGGESALYASDVFHHPLQIADPRICTQGDADPPLALATRRATVAECRERGTLVIGCHFPGSGAGHITGTGYEPRA